MIRHWIFDWSGTIADDLAPVIAASNGVLAHFGHPPLGREEFRERFRLPYDGFYRQFLPDVPIEEIQRLYHAHFDDDKHEVTLLPYAPEFLARCRALGGEVIVMSSAPHVHVLAQARRLGVEDFFHEWHCGVMDKPSFTAELLLRKGWPLAETAFVGDMTHDMNAAKANGILGIALLTGYESAGSLLEASPGILARDLSEVALLAGDPRNLPLNVRPVATVGALIENARGEWLMVRTHKWSNRWGIPGGKIERGETSAAALLREVREETGLTLYDVTFAMVQDCIEPPEFERSAHFLLLNYTAKTKGDEVVLNDEAEEYRWVTTEEAYTLDLNEPTRILLNHVVGRNS